MSALPYLNDLIEGVKEHAASLEESAAEKTAAETAKNVDLAMPLAKEMFKLAQELKVDDPHCVSHADVQSFAQELLRRRHG